jgi:two-component system LytT family response regulator
VAAFEAAALDYLLKPIAAPRLAQAMQRARARPPAAPAGTARPRAALPLRQLVIPDRDRLVIVPIPDIVWLEAADNYVVVHSLQGSPLMRRTLSSLVDDLHPTVMRTHRSAAVACAHVTGVSGRGNGDRIVHLVGGATAPCSRHYRDELLARLASVP